MFSTTLSRCWPSFGFLVQSRYHLCLLPHNYLLPLVLKEFNIVGVFVQICIISNLAIACRHSLYHHNALCEKNNYESATTRRVNEQSI